MMNDLLESVRPIYFFVSAIIFLVGIYVGPVIVEKGWSLLLKYPRWLFRLMQRYLDVRFRFVYLFLIIVLLNNISLFGSFAAGFLIIVPPAAAFFTGFNVAVITYDIAGWKGIWHMLFNPVAWLEFPAAWLSFSLGFQLAEIQLRHWHWSDTYRRFVSLVPIYLKYVFTLLILAALLESAMIVIARKYDDENRPSA